MRVLGLSCFYHDSAACLVEDGAVLAAAHEERFTRKKACADLPLHAVNACLQQAGLTINDVDHLAFYEKPYLKLERVIVSHLRAWPRSLGTFLRTMPAWLEDRLILPMVLANELGWEGEISFLRHHLAHAASSFLCSPFERAAILTMDGVGEWATTTLGRGEGREIHIEQELRFPDSLGLLYTAVTTWLGFEALKGEGKVMALADYAEPRFIDLFHEIVDLRDDGSFRVDPSAFGMVEGSRMYGPGFLDRFGPPREPGEAILPHHEEVAASLQAFLEKALLRTVRHLHRTTGLNALCVAGGVGLNISATSRIVEETPFQELFIQPAAGDAGAALGAALALCHELKPDCPRVPLRHAYLGPSFQPRAIARTLRAHGDPALELDLDLLIDKVVERVAKGGVVGWFQDRMEYGPRALGARSIMADPRKADMKEILNARVKHREPFRPYGVSILREAVGDWFYFDRASPFMLQVAQVREDQRDRIPAAVHVNGTTRLQTVTEQDNPLYYRLIKRFAEATGVPMLINTSFNDNNEPIVCTPEDAWDCYQRTGMDALAMGPYWVERT